MVASSVHCINTTSSTPLTILCTIPTRNFQQTAANATISLHADDDNHYPNKIKCNNNALYPTILQEWEAFYNEFVNSTTYALEHLTASLIISPVVNNDDNGSMSKCSNTMPLPPNSFDDSL